MKKYTTSVLLGSLLLAGAASAQQTAFLDLAAADGNLGNGTTTVTTAIVGSDGATFDLTYTLGATSNYTTSFVGKSAGQYGVGWQNDDGLGGITNDVGAHENTLEGDDGEGISFTSLTLSAFVAGSTYTELEYSDSLTFSGFTVGAAGHTNDGVNISYAAFNVDADNENLNNNGAGLEFIPLVGRTNFDAAGSATSLYLLVDSGQSNNRWSVSGLQVSYVPEPSSYALLAGLAGLSFVMLRRRQA